MAKFQDHDESLSDARKDRFSNQHVGNRYPELKVKREIEYKQAMRDGKIPDPNKRTTLENAITLVGTCMDMCPLFEREQREFENSVSRFEISPETGRIHPAFAIKCYKRPDAGQQISLPSDTRPPEVLKKTLDYITDDFLQTHDLFEPGVQEFVWNRTREIRADFVRQHQRGPLAIECHERICRFHILSIHELRTESTQRRGIEAEQLYKAFQSLIQYYDDAKLSPLPIPTPNEPEFRSYYLLLHLRDPEIARKTDLLPPHTFSHPLMQSAIKFRALAQRNNNPPGRRGLNAEGSQNMFSQFFKLAASLETSFLTACILEKHFTDVRNGALKAMTGRYQSSHRAFPIGELTEMMGFDGDEETVEMLHACGFTTFDGTTAEGLPMGVKLVRPKAEFTESAPIERPTRFVADKREGWSYPDIINGRVPLLRTSASSLKPRKVSLRAPPVRQPSISRPTGFSTSAPQSAFSSRSFPVPVLVQVPQAPTGFSSNGSNGATSVFGVVPSLAARPLPGPSTATAPSSAFSSTFTSPFANLSSTGAGPSTGSTSGARPPPIPVSPTQVLQPLRRKLDDLNAPFLAMESTWKMGDGGYTVNPTPPPIPISVPPPMQQQQQQLPLRASNFFPAPPSLPPTANPQLPTTASRPILPLPRSRIPSATSTEVVRPTEIVPPRSGLISSTRSRAQRSSIVYGSPIDRTAILRSPDKSFTAEPEALPVTREPDAEDEDDRLEREALLKRSARLDTLASQALSSILSGLALVESADTLASEQHRRSTLRSALGRWRSRLAKVAQSQLFVLEGQKKIREMLTHAPPVEEEMEVVYPYEDDWEDSQAGQQEFVRPQPVKDDDFAETLEKANKEREHLWRPGTFLSALRTRLDYPAPEGWDIWLVTAEEREDDSTALWLREKLDMREGEGDRRGVYRRALGEVRSGMSKSKASTSSPGLILFEISREFSNVADAAERNEIWQAQLHRLRKILNSLPLERTYLPSLVLLAWAGRTGTTTELRDFLTEQMTKFFSSPLIHTLIEGFHALVLPSSTAELDRAFAHGLANVRFDLEGRGRPRRTIRVYLEPFQRVCQDTLSRSLATLNQTTPVNWIQYAHLFEAWLTTLNELISFAWSTALISPPVHACPGLLPAFGGVDGVEDEKSLYSAVLDYLDVDELKVYVTVMALRNKLQYRFEAGEAFPLSLPLKTLLDTILFELALAAGDAESRPPSEDEDTILKKFEDKLQLRFTRVFAGGNQVSTPHSQHTKKRSYERRFSTDYVPEPVKRSKPLVPHPPQLETVKPLKAPAPATKASLMETIKNIRATYNLPGRP